MVSPSSRWFLRAQGLALFAVLTLFAFPAHALENSFHFKAGYDFGGDALVTAIFVGGDTETIDANEGLYFGAGVSLLNDAKDIETEISLSYKFETITASNGEITFDRMPLEALVFYRLPTVRVGGGLTYHLSPELDASGVVSGSVEFKDAMGFVLQADWRLGDKLNLGLRYTVLDYEVDGASGKIDSNGLGIVFSGSF